MKKSHQWDLMEELTARCPYCTKETIEYCGPTCEGDIVYCKHCGKKFELGRQK